MEIVAFLKRLQSHSITPFFTSIHAYTQICPTGYQLRAQEVHQHGGDWRLPLSCCLIFWSNLSSPSILYYSILAGNSRRVFLSCFSNVQGLLFVVVSRSSSSTHSSSFPHPCKQGAHTLETLYSQNSQFSLQFFFIGVIWFSKVPFSSHQCYLKIEPFHLFLEPKYFSVLR